MKLNYTEEFKDGLKRISDYIALDSVARAKKFISQMLEEISRLKDFPCLGSVPKNERMQKDGFKMLIYRDYLIFYLIDDSKKIINVVSVQHGSKLYDLDLKE